MCVIETGLFSGLLPKMPAIYYYRLKKTSGLVENEFPMKSGFSYFNSNLVMVRNINVCNEHF